MIFRVHKTNITYHCWYWPWSSGWGRTCQISALNHIPLYGCTSLFSHLLKDILVLGDCEWNCYKHCINIWWNSLCLALRKHSGVFKITSWGFLYVICEKGICISSFSYIYIFSLLFLSYCIIYGFQHYLE